MNRKANRKADTRRTRLMTLLAVLGVALFLREAYAVLMPLAVAVVVIAAIWPVRIWLLRWLPKSGSNLVAMLLLLFVVGVFFSAIYFSAAQVIVAFTDNWSMLRQNIQPLNEWAQRWGVNLGTEEGYSRVAAAAQAILANGYSAAGYMGFVAVIVALGLSEVPSLRAKLGRELHARQRREIVAAVDDIAAKIRSYLGVTAATSLLTGSACFFWTLLLGLDLALVWGILNFLLNFIPVLGNLIGIFPPTLYALIQFGGWIVPTGVFLGLAVIQIVISNFIYPLLQGKSLSLSPVAIIIALSFWTWVWGVAGALIAVPLTAAALITCEHFESTRWIAMLLSRGPSTDLGDSAVREGDHA